MITETNLDDSADVFPQLAGAGFASKSPEFKTVRREAQSGRVIKNSKWSSPRWNFKVSYEFLRDNVTVKELARLWAFFMSAFGMCGGWWYHDQYDDTVTGGTLGTGDGTTTDFQASRTRGSGYGYAFNEPVYGFWLTPIVYINGTPTTSFTVQPWGAIRFNTAPTAGQTLTWSGKFLFPCEFTNDDIGTTQLLTSLFSADGVEFRTIKP